MCILVSFWYVDVKPCNTRPKKAEVAVEATRNGREPGADLLRPARSADTRTTSSPCPSRDFASALLKVHHYYSILFSAAVISLPQLFHCNYSSTALRTSPAVMPWYAVSKSISSKRTDELVGVSGRVRRRSAPRRDDSQL
jgi:hypothetical protein